MYTYLNLDTGQTATYSSPNVRLANSDRWELTTEDTSEATAEAVAIADALPTILTDAEDDRNHVRSSNAGIEARIAVHNLDPAAHPEVAYEQTTTGAATTIDLGNGPVQTLILDHDTTVTITGAPDAPNVGLVMLYLVQGEVGSKTPTFADTEWPEDTPPTWSTDPGSKDGAVFETVDGGANFTGTLTGVDYR
ncbi:MAG: hypothetical protein EPO06_12085 [Burkholderiaceae bacterium]|nr:MAG: hypothetical protein EPO06_12085 [Burkholderiaceae bacterium]